MKKYLGYLLASFAIFLAHVVPFNMIIGSWHAYFSWTTIVTPVVNAYYPCIWMIVLFFSSKKFSATVLLLQGLPTFGAASAYQKQHWFWSILVPLVCQILFWSHEVGSAAWLYATYWFIPMVLFFTAGTIFTRATTAVFVSHAIGSVIWLYSGNIAPSVWIALIPVVFVERALMVIGMIVCDIGLQKVMKSSRHFWNKQAAGVLV